MDKYRKECAETTKGGKPVLLLTKRRPWYDGLQRYGFSSKIDWFAWLISTIRKEHADISHQHHRLTAAHLFECLTQLFKLSSYLVPYLVAHLVGLQHIGTTAEVPE